MNDKSQPKRPGLLAVLCLVCMALLATACGSSSEEAADSPIESEDADSEDSSAESDDSESEDDEDTDEPAAGTEDDDTDDNGTEDDDTEDDGTEDDEEEPESGDEENPEPTSGDSAVAALSLLQSGELAYDLSPEAEECAVEALTADDELLDGIIAVTSPSELDVEQQAAAAMVLIECDPDAVSDAIAEGFSEDSDFAPEGLEDCFAEAFTGGNPDVEQLLIGFISLGEEMELPPASKDPLLDTMTECIPGSVMTDEILDGFGEELDGAVDEQCLSETFDNGGLRTLFEAIIESPGGDSDSLPSDVQLEVFDPIFSCISMATVLASSFAEDGVVLSDESVACLEAELADFNFAELTLGANPNAEAELGATAIGCLNTDELTQLGQ